MNWMKIGAVAIAAAAFFMGGYRYAAALYSGEMAALREAQARAVQRMQEGQIDALAERERRLAAAVDERDAALGKLATWERSGSVLLERMRNAELRASRVSASRVDSRNVDRVPDARCRELLVRCGDLVARGGKLLGELNADREAVRKINCPECESASKRTSNFQ